MAVEEEIEQADAFEEKIYAATVNIDKHCATGVRGGSPDRSRTSTEPARAPASCFPPITGVILPQIRLDITTFWDSFESAIDSNTGLSEIDKFNYL